jgi:hypothetical protein
MEYVDCSLRQMPIILFWRRTFYFYVLLPHHRILIKYVHKTAFIQPELIMLIMNGWGQMHY